MVCDIANKFYCNFEIVFIWANPFDTGTSIQRFLTDTASDKLSSVNRIQNKKLLSVFHKSRQALHQQESAKRHRTVNKTENNKTSTC